MPENDDIGIDLDRINKLNADISIVHHFHKYIKTEYERNNIFCLGDFLFNRPGKLEPKRPSATVIVKQTGNGLMANSKTFQVDEVYEMGEMGLYGLKKSQHF